MMRMAGVAESRIKRSNYLLWYRQVLSTAYMQSTHVALMLW